MDKFLCSWTAYNLPHLSQKFSNFFRIFGLIHVPQSTELFTFLNSLSSRIIASRLFNHLYNDEKKVYNVYLFDTTLP
jgi:hypothetical protein